MSGKLYVVATPIGNLEDITIRALNVLKSVALIACEDTRHTAKLLKHYEISTPTISYHEHNEKERALQILGRLEQGDSVALVSDAGTPLLSDPGHVIVCLAIEAGFKIEPVPGASALLAGLVASGLPLHDFFFCGFLPARASQRRRRLRQLLDIGTTLVFYEAPHRIREALQDLSQVCPDITLVVARELTKLHEEFLRGTPTELLEKLTFPRGEFVILLDSRQLDSSQATVISDNKSIKSRVEALQMQGLDRMDAIKQVAKKLGISKSEAYRRLQEELSQ
ncbi:MAG: 16S rRNA (cytidine(1402)-2'-O)-methyltransferase [Acidobacteriota bacterium]|nr:16S rRNA (cytidine(1402)-2'-O)-methyltransferase [Blastocatellia bacterium]MDW8412121.1 16S rRNA (cytidine(1402)-2'-O)-methyltransferase [Acidobacteriota bacterium]